MNRIISRRERGTQTPVILRSERSTQIGEAKVGLKTSGSYNRKRTLGEDGTTATAKMNFRLLLTEVINSKENIIKWSKDQNLIATERSCPTCSSSMNFERSSKTSDGWHWRCQRMGHDKEVSIRKNSWYESGNLTMEEIVEFTYWWTTGNQRSHRMYSYLTNDKRSLHNLAL